MSGRFRALPVYVGAFLVFLYAPSLLLPVFAFNDSRIIAFPLSGFTLEWFQVLQEADALHDALGNSLLVAAVTSVLSTSIGTFAARGAVRYRFPAKGGIMGFIMLPLVLPEIAVGVSLLVTILQLGMDLSLLTIVLGHVLVCTPFCIAILSSTFQNFDRSLEEASIDLGHSRVSTFFRITLPLVMPGLIASLLIAFTISLDEFIIAFFLSGTETTLPVYIWGQLRFPQRIPALMAVGTLLLFASLIMLGTAEFFRRRTATVGASSKGGNFL